MGTNIKLSGGIAFVFSKNLLKTIQKIFFMTVIIFYWKYFSLYLRESF